LARSLEPRCHELAARVEQMLSRDLDEAEADELRGSLGIVIRTINTDLAKDN
jgi:hypothetical protein